MRPFVKTMISTLLCFSLISVIIIGTVRVIVSSTLLNEQFHYKEQERARYYDFIRSALVQELSQIVRDYQLPGELANELLTVEDVKVEIQTQTKDVLEFHDKKNESFPVRSFDHILDKFKNGVSAHEQAMIETNQLNVTLDKASLYREVEQVLNKYLTIIDADAYFYNPDLAPVRAILYFFSYEWINIVAIVLVGIIILLYRYLVRKPLIEVFNFISFNTVIAGLILFFGFATLRTFTYSIAGQQFPAGRRLMYDVTFNQVFYKILAYGSCLVIIGVIFIIGGMIFKQLRDNRLYLEKGSISHEDHE